MTLLLEDYTPQARIGFVRKLLVEVGTRRPLATYLRA